MTTPPTLSRSTVVFHHVRASVGRATYPYLVHQAVADLFGDREGRGYLYRVLQEADGTFRLLVLSEEPPVAISAIPSLPHRQFLSLESKPFLPDLSRGQALDCEVRVNATKAIAQEQRRGKVEEIWFAEWSRDHDTPLTPEAVYESWLTRKLAGVATLRPCSVALTERGEVAPRRYDGKPAGCFVVANVIAQLTVDDPAGLVTLLAQGIGRARAFGCGLLCLSRPGTVLARRHHE